MSKIDWNVLKSSIKVDVPPRIVVQHEDTEDSYEIFRRLSHLAAHSRYDLPQDHGSIVAYAQRGSEEPEAIGIITYWVTSDDVIRKTFEFMDDYFHKISFLFVHPRYQGQTVGSQLLSAAMSSIKNSRVDRPIRLEGAKSAVKFFRKKGFVSIGPKEMGSNGRGSRLFSSYFNMQHKFA